MWFTIEETSKVPPCIASSPPSPMSTRKIATVSKRAAAGVPPRRT